MSVPKRSSSAQKRSPANVLSQQEQEAVFVDGIAHTAICNANTVVGILLAIRQLAHDSNELDLALDALATTALEKARALEDFSEEVGRRARLKAVSK